MRGAPLPSTALDCTRRLVKDAEMTWTVPACPRKSGGCFLGNIGVSYHGANGEFRRNDPTSRFL